MIDKINVAMYDHGMGCFTEAIERWAAQRKLGVDWLRLYDPHDSGVISRQGLVPNKKKVHAHPDLAVFHLIGSNRKRDIARCKSKVIVVIGKRSENTENLLPSFYDCKRIELSSVYLNGFQNRRDIVCVGVAKCLQFAPPQALPRHTEREFPPVAHLPRFYFCPTHTRTAIHDARFPAPKLVPACFDREKLQNHSPFVTDAALPDDAAILSPEQAGILMGLSQPRAAVLSLQEVKRSLVCPPVQSLYYLLEALTEPIVMAWPRFRHVLSRANQD